MADEAEKARSEARLAVQKIQAELSTVESRAAAECHALLLRLAAAAGAGELLENGDTPLNAEDVSELEAELHRRASHAADQGVKICQLEDEAREAREREDEAKERASVLEVTVHTSRMEIEAASATIAVLRSQSSAMGVHAEELEPAFAKLSEMRSRVADLESELDEARRTSQESEHKRIEMHRCLVDLSAGVSAHRQHVRTLKDMHARRDKVQTEQIAQLQRDKEALSYSVRRLHAESQESLLTHGAVSVLAATKSNITSAETTRRAKSHLQLDVPLYNTSAPSSRHPLQEADLTQINRTRGGATRPEKLLGKPDVLRAAPPGTAGDCFNQLESGAPCLKVIATR
mmetsp:Transcript_11217/g.37160  ORF Transcript_11217/g.37160 Transcript_11217/m.37160 type:complete len:346 (+) Transcript_11217:87-1124(+)